MKNIRVLFFLLAFVCAPVYAANCDYVTELLSKAELLSEVVGEDVYNDLPVLSTAVGDGCRYKSDLQGFISVNPKSMTSSIMKGVFIGTSTPFIAFKIIEIETGKICVYVIYEVQDDLSRSLDVFLSGGVVEGGECNFKEHAIYCNNENPYDIDCMLDIFARLAEGEEVENVFQEVTRFDPLIQISKDEYPGYSSRLFDKSQDGRFYSPHIRYIKYRSSPSCASKPHRPFESSGRGL